jgi:hypothetical protein
MAGVKLGIQAAAIRLTSGSPNRHLRNPTIMESIAQSIKRSYRRYDTVPRYISVTRGYE